MINVSKADMNFLIGNGANIVSSKPMIRKQGNGNFTGFMANTWSDGEVTTADFIVNAKTKEEVIEAWRG